jgi:hypothetical protein
METILTSRFGLYTETEGGLKEEPANLPSYGVFKCHQKFVPSNVQLTLNSVTGDVVDKASTLVNLREYEFGRRKINDGKGPRPQAHEDRYQQRTSVPVADGDPCPVQNVVALWHKFVTGLRYASHRYPC